MPVLSTTVADLSTHQMIRAGKMRIHQRYWGAAPMVSSEISARTTALRMWVRSGWKVSVGSAREAVPGAVSWVFSVAELMFHIVVKGVDMSVIVTGIITATITVTVAPRVPAGAGPCRWSGRGLEPVPQPEPDPWAARGWGSAGAG